MFNFDDADLALMCASHNSERMHIERGESMLRKLGLDETSLHCGGHDSLSREVCADWIRRGYTPSAICNDCSGKHIGMLSSSLALQVPIDGYHQVDHPTQVRIAETMEQVLDLDRGIYWAVDGCNLPAFRLSPAKLAFLYGRLADAHDVEGTSDLKTRGDMARVFRAMSRYPELVARTDRIRH